MPPRTHRMMMTPAINPDNLPDGCLLPLSFLLDIHDKTAPLHVFSIFDQHNIS